MERVKNQAFKNENGFLDSPEAPLEQASLSYNCVANAGQDWLAIQLSRDNPTSNFNA